MLSQPWRASGWVCLSAFKKCSHTRRPQHRAQPNIDKTWTRCFSIPHLRKLSAISVGQRLWQLQGNLAVQQPCFEADALRIILDTTYYPPTHPKEDIFSYTVCTWGTEWQHAPIYTLYLQTSPFTTRESGAGLNKGHFYEYSRQDFFYKAVDLADESVWLFCYHFSHKHWLTEGSFEIVRLPNTRAYLWIPLWYFSTDE